MHMVRCAWRRLCALALLALAGCAPNAPQDTLVPDGPIARQIDGLFKPVFWVAAGVFFLVEGILVVALVRFRESRRRGAGEPVQMHGNTRLEIGWTLAPALLLAIVAVPTVAAIVTLSREPAASDNPLKVTVTGKQWWWDYKYEELDVRTANELHIPVGRPVLLKLESEDVIHSYWVPKLAGKQDVVPGQTNYLTIKADKPGRYMGQCAEFCALSHANMRLLVIAQSEEDFDEWVDRQSAPGTAPTDAAAKAVFEDAQKCAKCHAVKGTDVLSTTGPDLTHFASRKTFGGATYENTRENLIRWLRDPPAMKPGSKMPRYDLTEDEIEALVSYLESLE